MQILRVFNNNVVLARRDGEPVVVTGRGVGFGVKQGGEVDPSRVQRIFVPIDGRDPDHAGEMIAGLDAQTVDMVADALDEVGVNPRLTLVTAIADHVTGAAKRARMGTTVEYPLRAEVAHLYPDEAAQGERLLDVINRRLANAGADSAGHGDNGAAGAKGGADSAVAPFAPLPREEATALTLHLVNAGFNTGNLAHTYRMTGVIQQMLAVIGAEWGVEVDGASISTARFITHARYLFVRLERGEQLDHGNSPLTRELMRAHPHEMAIARKVAHVVELRFGQSLTDDEVAYLGLHVARLQEARAGE